MGLPAVMLHLTLAGLRNWRPDPRSTLQPGRYPDRHIQRLDLPTPQGPVPALHIVPTGQAGAPHAAVCYLNGSGGDKYFHTWAIADALIARGLAVLLIDLDGHGTHPRPQAFPAIVQTAAGALAWLRERSTRVGLVGMSLGGCVAARAAADGAPVDALAVLAAPLHLNLTRDRVWREVRELAQPAVLAQLHLDRLYHEWRIWSETPPIRASIGTAPLIDALDLGGSLVRLGQRSPALPLLLIYAGRDAIVPSDQAASVRAILPATARFHLLPRASHLSLLLDDRTPQLLGDWFAAQLGEPAPTPTAAPAADP